MGIGYVRAGLCYGGPAMVPEQQHDARLLARAFRQHQTVRQDADMACRQKPEPSWVQLLRGTASVASYPPFAREAEDERTSERVSEQASRRPWAGPSAVGVSRPGRPGAGRILKLLVQ
jgi:hypothetical protein